ncbi:LysR substrate-binding domain-containing protein [Ramlibacter rhizophilus]|uniref:LysR family transcriptional regulator n=1 Tax=Ramlibacter rhizophilus TaxID=1781167 RepID=A0A4Z0BC76_9BURK|nr:LysR substrate-binding domain-containing protein [Ramlibacter rhizophilus]TFY96836.1 LysR family transcriptional regulator [Ramlibacter rhizophilus]
MDLKQIEYFVRVAELGSFTRASIALDVAQPALSRQVRMLEVELRQNLLVRNGRGAVPTEAGKLLLEHGRGILHQVERAREELGRARGALTGRVAVGLPPSIARVMAVPLIRAFRDRMPEASLSIMEGLSSGMRESLASGRMDIALVYNAAAAADVELSALVDEDLYLVQARGAQRASARPLALKELAEMPLVIPTRPNAIRMQVESALADLGLRPRIAFEIDAVAALLELVADGAGSAVLTRNAVMSSSRPQAFEMRPIGRPRLRSRLSMAVSPQRPSTLTQQATMELIQELAGKLLGRG